MPTKEELERLHPVALAVLCQRVADDSSICQATRDEALKLKLEWTALQTPPASNFKEEAKAESERQVNRERMVNLLATV